MFKQLLTGAIAVNLLLGSTTSVLAQAQEIIEPIQVAQASEGVSQEDLEKFANALVRIKVIEQQAIIAIIQEFKNQGFSKERFEAIVSAQQSQTALEPELTEEEKEKLSVINPQINEIREQAASQMNEAVEAQGLNPERYREILATVRQSPELKEQVQQLVEEIIKELREE